MGYDLGEGWAASMRKDLTALGINFSVRDPNWNVDAGAQTITSLISEKPDVIVVQNPDLNSYAKLFQRAEKAGIYVISVNMKTTVPTSAFVGADYIRIGEMEAERIVKLCGKGSGTSGKIALVQGTITAAGNAFNMKGIENVLSKHPEIKIVSEQAADWDATKARNITSTVLQANQDLCGVIGMWDVMDTGTAAAVSEFNKRAKRDKPVYLITSGAGAQFVCNNIADGTFTEAVRYDVPLQGHDISVIIQQLLQAKEKPGTHKISVFSRLMLVNKENLTPTSCWDTSELKKK